ncbi:MAG: class I SAM-dependent methyltransferase [Candidatus Woesearchaeota archaeon]
MKLREALKEVLSEETLQKTNTKFETVGDIAILELDEELREDMKTIAQTLLQLHKNISVVVRKASEHEGELRIQTYEHLAGEKRFETVAKENGVELLLDINKTYYSSKSQNERLRIINQVQPEERVLVMFSGIGPYSIAIAKNTQAKEVIGVELNKEANAYAQKNIQRNKTRNVQELHGDVEKIVPTLGLFERIIMPLPHTASNYLSLARTASKQQATIHLYCFCEEENIQAYAQSLLEEGEEILAITQAGTYNPAKNRYCIDIQTS